jgi:hypothetical protein
MKIWTLIPLAIASLCACGEKVDPGRFEVAPDFALVDGNPRSPTFEQERSLSAAAGSVVILSFVYYG